MKNKLFKKLELKARFRSPIFYVQLITAIFVPVFAYYNVPFEEIDTWKSLFELLVKALSNPYVVLIIVNSILNSIVPNRKYSKENEEIEDIKEEEEVKVKRLDDLLKK